MQQETHWRYVRHHEVEKFEALGWVKTDKLVGTHHEYHAVLMHLGPLNSEDQPHA